MLLTYRCVHATDPSPCSTVQLRAAVLVRHPSACKHYFCWEHEQTAQERSYLLLPKGQMRTNTQKCAPLCLLLQRSWGSASPSLTLRGMSIRVGNICPSAHSRGVSGFIGRSTDPHGTHNVAHCVCTTTNRLNQ